MAPQRWATEWISGKHATDDETNSKRRRDRRRMADHILEKLEFLESRSNQLDSIVRQLTSVNEKLTDHAKQMDHMSSNLTHLSWNVHQMVGFQTIATHCHQQYQHRLDTAIDKLSEASGRMNANAGAKVFERRLEYLSKKADQTEAAVASIFTRLDLLERKGTNGSDSCEALPEPLGGRDCHANEFVESDGTSCSGYCGRSGEVPLSDSVQPFRGTWERMVSQMILYTKRRHLLVAKCEHIQERTDIPIMSDSILWDTFGGILAECPERPRTALNRDRFKEKYGNINGKSFWYDVTRKLHNGTGDPLCKSDLFLELMAMIFKANGK